MNAMSNFLRTGSVRGIRMLTSEGAKPRQREHLPLQRFDNEHHPKQERSQHHGHINDNHQKWSEDRNQEYRHAQNAQRESDNDTGKPDNKTLCRMEAHEFILAIRIDQKEN